jgi:hypothetical protein
MLESKEQPERCHQLNKPRKEYGYHKPGVRRCERQKAREHRGLGIRALSCTGNL